MPTMKDKQAKNAHGLLTYQKRLEGSRAVLQTHHVFELGRLPAAYFNFIASF